MSLIETGTLVIDENTTPQWLNAATLNGCQIFASDIAGSTITVKTSPILSLIHI